MLEACVLVVVGKVSYLAGMVSFQVGVAEKTQDDS